MEWKKIETEQPKEGENCLIVSEHGKDTVRMVIAVWKEGKFWAYNWFDDELEEAEEFTHWMPRPLPPSAMA